MAKTKCDLCNENFKNEEALDLHIRAKHAELCGTPDPKTPKTSKKSRNVFILIGLVLLGIIAYFLFFSGPSGNYDSFAQCITASGAKMYGAYWCPHCQDQKEMFGSSWQYIDYVECSLPNRAGQTEECTAAGIEGYPTWEFGDGGRISGTLSFTQLAEITGCDISPEEANN